jgi:long-chain acyl-CoA synthetase
MNTLEISHIDELFKSCVEKNAGSPFIYFNGETFSYGRCDELIEKTAKKIPNAENKFIGLISSNRTEFVIGYLAILRAGGKVVPINPKLGAEEIEYIVTDANVGFIIHFGEIPLNLPFESLVIDSECKLNLTVTEGIFKSLPITFPEIIDDVAVCIYTSGTTGRPKGALLTHSAVIQNAKICSEGLDCTLENECFVAVLPLYHAYAASACLIQSMWTKSKMLIIETFNPPEVLRQMEEHKATAFLGVPAMYAVLANLKNVPKIPEWRLCVSGGAPLPEAVNNAFVEKFKIQIHEGDGPTECGPVTSINPVGGKIKVGTIGIPLAGVEMKIVDAASTELIGNEVGEIIVKSPSNFIGYLNQPEESAKTIVDGWVYTGDLGTKDEEGYFSIVDRKKDMLIVGGLNVYPREVEEYIYHHPAVAEAAVIGESHEIRGEIPVAFVSLKEEESLTLADLKSFLKDKIAKYKTPRKLHVLDSLPRNSTGKILKTVLRNTNH